MLDKIYKTQEEASKKAIESLKKRFSNSKNWKSKR